MNATILDSVYTKTHSYKIRDVAVRVNRNKRAVIRWELSGRIPPAKRNASGERTYTEEDIQKILDLFKKDGFYRRRPKR